MGIETAISIAGSAYQMIKGAQAQAEANQAASNAANRMAQLEQLNAFKDLQIPTLGLDLAQQNIQQKQSQDVRALQEMGPAGVLGGLTGTQQQAQAQNLQLAALANEAQYNRDVAVRQQQQAINAEKTARLANLEQQRLAGAQAAATRGAQEQQAAISGGAGAILNQAFMNQYFNQNKQAPGISQTTPTALPLNATQVPGSWQINPMNAMSANPAQGFAPVISSNPYAVDNFKIGASQQGPYYFQQNAMNPSNLNAFGIPSGLTSIFNPNVR
jgi:hypothetical protein